MHAFIRGRDVGFSAGRFYGGVADLLAGVEEEEGYVIDGRWVSWQGKEERKKKTMEVLTRAEEGASNEAGNADIIRRTASDKERWRMEEVLRSAPSPPLSQSSPSSHCHEERVELHLEIQRRRRASVAVESEGPQDRDVVLQGDIPKDVDHEWIISDSVPQEREEANLSTAHTQSRARSRESLPRL